MSNTNPSGADGTASAERGQGSGLVDGAKEATTQVASTAKDEAGRVVREATGQGRQLLTQVGSEAKQQAGAQQQRAAQGLQAIGDELQGMASSSEGGGVATELVGNLAERVTDAARWLEARDPGSALAEVKSFARRRPGVFIAVAAGVGVLAGRLVRNLSDSGDQDAAPGSPPTPTTAPSTGVGGVGSETPTFDQVVSETGTGALR